MTDAFLLELTGTQPDVAPTLVDDFYIPFKVTTPKVNNMAVGHILLETPNPNDGLIDIEIDVDFGQLVELTVVHWPKPSLEMPPPLDLREETALPVFGADVMPSDALQPIKRFHVAMAMYESASTRYVALTGQAPDQLINCAGLHFCFTARQLVGLQFPKTQRPT